MPRTAIPKLLAARLAPALLLSTLAFPAVAARWFLVAVENEPLYKAIGAFRVETTLFQTDGTSALLWVRTDYLRPKGFKYPRNPRAGTLVDPTAVMWRKERFTVDCQTQQVAVDNGSYVVANDDIQWDSQFARTVVVSPNTIFDLAYRLACDKGSPRTQEALEQVSGALESKLVPKAENREKLREEKNRPDLSKV